VKLAGRALLGTGVMGLGADYNAGGGIHGHDPARRDAPVDRAGLEIG
jgi:hypothetical protein